MPKWNKAKRIQVGLILLLVTAYVALLLRNLHESERRSLQMQAETLTGDYVRVSVRIVDVNTHTSEMTARMRFRLAGDIAKDEVTPATDLRLFLNNTGESQEFDFPRGQRMAPIVVTFALEGNINRYPFDTHEADIRMLMTRPIRGTPPPAASEKDDEKKQEKQPEPAFGDLAVGTAAMQRRETVPISTTLSASIPGLKFDGRSSETQTQGVEAIQLSLRRADNVIALSTMIMVLMMCLAVSVLLMATKALTHEGNVDLTPLSLSVTLLFGLPALRASQPGVPPVGAFSDYLSFVWAELLVALSAIMIAWAWLRSRKSRSRTDA